MTTVENCCRHFSKESENYCKKFVPRSFLRPSTWPAQDLNTPARQSVRSAPLPASSEFSETPRQPSRLALPPDTLVRGRTLDTGTSNSCCYPLFLVRKARHCAEIHRPAPGCRQTAQSARRLSADN